MISRILLVGGLSCQFIGGCGPDLPLEPFSSATTRTTTGAAIPASGGVNVVIASFAFNPGRLTISRGTTVTWTNSDNIHHSVSSGVAGKPSGIFAGTLPTVGSTYSYKFDVAGEFPYFCDYHPAMTGMVIVQP